MNGLGEGYARGRKNHTRALAYAGDTRLKFERVYESARKAIAAGDTKTALLKCRAALDLLEEKNVYGLRQSAIAKRIKDQIRRLREARRVI